MTVAADASLPQVPDSAPPAAPATAPSQAPPGEGGVLGRYFLLTWILLVLNASRFLFGDRVQGAAAVTFSVAVLLTYAALYLVPAVVVVLVVHGLFGRGPGARLLAALRVPPRLAVRALAVLLGAGTQMFIHADSIIYRMYGFHVNGFVLNLVQTPGGIEATGADTAMKVTMALLGLGFLAVQAGLLVAAVRWRGLADRWPGWVRPRRLWAALGLFLLVALGERVSYGLSDVYGYRPVLHAASVFPFYAPIRFRNFARRMGIEGPDRRDLPELKSGAGSLVYPRHPLTAPADAPRTNIVWLVSESLRFDMLDPAIMPETCAFAAKATDFRRHFSSGNGTRMGVFGMFYGLYGPYWSPFLQELRPPVLFDFLLDRGYQVEAYTSARFTFPEFDRTVFKRFPSDKLHEGDPATLGWQNDRRNVGLLLDSIDKRDKSRPFFEFMFFESPHAPYHFPEESVIRPDYFPKMNYVTMGPADLAKNMDRIKDRYVNSCRHLDGQFARVIRGLEERGLMDNTILILTGDHGEEFMERGRWGHHSGFNRFQTQTPMIIHAPGRAPGRVERMTSHNDLPATVLTMLGVKNPPSDYSLGYDMFGSVERTETVISGYDNLADKDAKGTLVSPMGRAGLVDTVFLDADDRELPDAEADRAIQASGGRLKRVLEGLAQFRKK